MTTNCKIFRIQLYRSNLLKHYKNSFPLINCDVMHKFNLILSPITNPNSTQSPKQSTAAEDYKDI